MSSDYLRRLVVPHLVSLSFHKLPACYDEQHDMISQALISLFTEFFPVIAFFISAQFYSFETATAILIVSILLAFSVSWYTARRLPVLPIISGTLSIIFGLLTIKNHSPNTLILADSLYYFVMCLIVIGGLIYGRNVLQMIFERTIAISPKGWSILTYRWLVVFILAGVGNEIIRYGFTPETWVKFKVFKVFSITLFGAYQITLTRKYRLAEASNEWGIRTDK